MTQPGFWKIHWTIGTSGSGSGDSTLTESINAWDRVSWAWGARTGYDEAAAHGMTYE
jgi:hypothetical protein